MAKNAYTDGRMHTLHAAYPACGWDALCEEFEILLPLAACMQDRHHHGEGDVATHTRMVLGHLTADPDYLALSEEDRFMMFWTCVFHDVGKPEKTVTEADGSITSRGHSRLGAMIARETMREAGMPFEMREHMCAIIAAHQVPFWLFEREDQRRLAIRLSLELDTRLLCMHALADARGRVCLDPEDIVLRAELSRAAFVEHGVYGVPFAFANDESRMNYFEKEDRDPNYVARENWKCNVTVMCGLPGSGKDTWIAANAPELPMVSMDDIRKVLGVDPTGNQGEVRQRATEMAREHLRAGRDFVWNTVSVTLDMRSPIISLARDYGARVRIVYLETSPETLLRQNNERRETVPLAHIERLVRKLDPPKDWEAHEVLRVVDLSPKRDRKRSFGVAALNRP